MINYIKEINELLISVDFYIVESFRLGKAVIYDDYNNEHLVSGYYKDKLINKCELLEVYCRALRDKLENESENKNE
jgi:hypothetical protein